MINHWILCIKLVSAYFSTQPVCWALKIKKNWFLVFKNECKCYWENAYYTNTRTPILNLQDLIFEHFDCKKKKKKVFQYSAYNGCQEIKIYLLEILNEIDARLRQEIWDIDFKNSPTFYCWYNSLAFDVVVQRL